MANKIALKKENQSIPKSPTGIKGLDEITYGGFPKNRPTLIVGGIGSGKTFMSLQFIVNGIINQGEPGVFMTFEEKTEEIISNASNLGANLSALIKENKFYLEHLHISNYELHESGKYNIDGLFVRIEQAIKKIGAKRIVLDSLDTLFTNLDIKLLKNEFKRLFFWLKEKEVTALITAEQGDIYITRLGLEENVADCVLELTNRVVNQIATRRVRIIKYRGSYHENNEYPFIINNDGMSVFPIVNQLDNVTIKNDIIPMGINDFDEMLEKKGFYVGSSILISGSSGTGKTSLVSTFINNACTDKKNCLFCAFEESPNQIIRNMRSINIDLQKQIDAGFLNFYYARPSLQNLELHFMSIREIIEATNPHVIVLDPITNLMTEGPNSDVRSMLTRFIDYIKTKQISVMFTAAITLGSIRRNPSDEGISSMVDTWVMVEDLVVEDERNRSICIIKSRGMDHSKEVREFVITKNGVQLRPFRIIKKESVDLLNHQYQKSQATKALLQLEKNKDGI